MPLSNLTAVNIVQSLKKGEFTCEELVTNYIDHINKYEKNVEAWEFFDETLILEQAKKLDQDHQLGKVHGDLHGVPVGIKDIFDTENIDFMSRGWNIDPRASYNIVKIINY